MKKALNDLTREDWNKLFPIKLVEPNSHLQKHTTWKEK